MAQKICAFILQEIWHKPISEEGRNRALYLNSQHNKIHFLSHGCGESKECGNKKSKNYKSPGTINRKQYALGQVLPT